MFKTVFLPSWFILAGLFSCGPDEDKEASGLGETAKEFKETAKEFNKKAGEFEETAKELEKSSCDFLLAADRFKINTCYYIVIKGECLEGKDKRRKCLKEVMDCKFDKGKFKKDKPIETLQPDDESCYPRYVKQQKRFAACIIENMLFSGRELGLNFHQCLNSEGPYAPQETQ